MAGSMFNPHDLLPNSLPSGRLPSSRASPAENSQHGGSINNDHLLYELTGYPVPYLENFGTLHSRASLSHDVTIPQNDTYQHTLSREGQQMAIHTSVDVPDDVVVQQPAWIRPDHENRSMYSSQGLATVPEAPHFPLRNSTTRTTLPTEMPLPSRRRSSQRSGPLRLQESWKRFPQQHRPLKASNASTTSSWSYEPSIFSQASLEPRTENSSRYPSGDYSTHASVVKTGLLDPADEPFANDMSGNGATQNHSTSGFPKAPTNTAIENHPVREHPNPPTKSQTSSSAIKFSCTLCDSKATFRGKSEWKRHELSHMPFVEYVCLPGGLIEEGPRCAICSVHNPDYQHILEHNAHLCLAKETEARTWVRKDKFIKHLASHGLSSTSPQVARWTRKLPNRLSGCGFCIRGFGDFNERSLHIAKHFEDGCDRADWDGSKVILGLLGQPHTATSWQYLLIERFGERLPTQIVWSEELAPGIQKRLEEGQDSGHNLALEAFQLCSLCRTAGQDQINNHQQTGGPNDDTAYPVEHLSMGDTDTSMPEASQSWFDDSEAIPEFTNAWGFLEP